MYYRALALATSLLVIASLGCSEQHESTRCSFSADDDTGGTLICRAGDATATIINQETESVTTSVTMALVTSWTDNGPAGGKAYRSKFKAANGGHYTTILDLHDLARVSSLSIAVHPADKGAEFTAAVVQASNTTGDVDLVSTSTELTDWSIVLATPFDVYRFSYNYRLDLNVGPDGSGDLDILSPPVVTYAKP